MRIWPKLAATAALIAATAACVEGPLPNHGPLRPSANPSAVIATELAFARAARERGTWTAFREYATPDALWPNPGLVNVHRSLTGWADPAQPIIWSPTRVWSSCDGSFAASTGWADHPDGSKGEFLTIWQRQRDGSYRWVLDQALSERPGAQRPEMASGIVADCPAARQFRQKVRRGEAWGSGESDDGTLTWETRIAADCSRTVRVAIARAGGRETVLARREPAPPARAGGTAPVCTPG